MTDENTEPGGGRVETAISVLDLAFHPNTGEKEALAAIHAYKRLSKGKVPSILCRDFYGDDSALILADEEWEEILAGKEIEISRLRNEIRRLKKALDASKRRVPRSEDQPMTETLPREVPALVITDQEWDIVVRFIPEKYRNEKGRVRLASMIVIVRNNIPWRVLGTEEKPDGWTTYYNQYHQKWRHEQWWINMMSALADLKKEQNSSEQ